MRARVKQFVARNARTARHNRATRRVKASPSILERPLNPVSLELVRFRKRLFMGQAAFAARIGMRLADLRQLEGNNIWNDAGKSLTSRMSAVRDLGILFGADSSALERAVKVELSASAHLHILEAVHQLQQAGCPLVDSFQLERVADAHPFIRMVARSHADLVRILRELKAWGCITFEEERIVWTGKPRLCQIQITTEGQQLAANHNAWRKGNLRPNRTRQAPCGKKAA